MDELPLEIWVIATALLQSAIAMNDIAHAIPYSHALPGRVSIVLAKEKISSNKLSDDANLFNPLTLECSIQTFFLLPERKIEITRYYPAVTKSTVNQVFIRTESITRLFIVHPKQNIVLDDVLTEIC